MTSGELLSAILRRPDVLRQNRYFICV